MRCLPARFSFLFIRLDTPSEPERETELMEGVEGTELGQWVVLFGLRDIE